MADISSFSSAFNTGTHYTEHTDSIKTKHGNYFFGHGYVYLNTTLRPYNIISELKIRGAHIVIFIRLGIKFEVENIGR